MPREYRHIQQYEKEIIELYNVLFSTLNDVPFFTLNGAVSA